MPRTDADGYEVSRVLGSTQSPFTASIANTESLSGAVALAERRAVRLVMPDNWDTADLTFQVSYDGSNFKNLYDETGNEVVVKAAAARSIRLPIADWLGIAYMKVRSGTSSAPVPQTAARSITVVAQ